MTAKSARLNLELLAEPSPADGWSREAESKNALGASGARFVTAGGMSFCDAVVFVEARTRRKGMVPATLKNPNCRSKRRRET